MSCALALGGACGSSGAKPDGGAGGHGGGGASGAGQDAAAGSGPDAASDSAHPEVGDSDASGLDGDGSDLARDGADAADDALHPAPVAKNYQLTGSMPQLKAAIATRPGKLQYRKLVIHDQFLAESCAIGDYNGDGVPDISSGRIWYEGTADPATTFKVQHPFRDGHGPLPRTGTDDNETQTGVSDDWSDFAWDVDGDGWTDIINVASPAAPAAGQAAPDPKAQRRTSAYWYRNPGAQRGGDANWKSTLINDDVYMEEHVFADVDGDGFPELFGSCQNCNPAAPRGYYQHDPADPAHLWTFHPVTIAYLGHSGYLGQKGIGAGDVDGDGRPDLLERGGVWLQKPENAWNHTVCTGANTPTGCGWIKEKTELLPTGIYDGAVDGIGTRGPAQIFAVDMDGDGLTDLVSADDAYSGEGLFWYRQTEGLHFVKYQFMGGNAVSGDPNAPALFGAGFTAPTAMQVVDMDGDGAPDVVTGKMRFPLPVDLGVPDPNGTPVVYVFKNIRGKTGPKGGPITLEPHLVDGDPSAQAGTPAGGMGVGRQIGVGQVDGDGIVDICVATKVGLAVFFGQ